jgi:hypothetical protein
LIGLNKDAEQGKVVWELDLPESLILARIHGRVWKDVIAGNEPLAMSKLCIPQDQPTPEFGEVLLAMPLLPTCQVKRLGSFQGQGSVTYSDLKELGANVSMSLTIR